MSVKRFDIVVDGSFPFDSDLLDCSDGLYSHGEVAQELYDALEQMKSFMAWRYGDDDQFVMVANSALAKARGEHD